MVLAASALENPAQPGEAERMMPLNVEQTKKLPRTGIHKILIRGTNWIGDAVLTLPAIASIRATYPKSHISLLAKPRVADIYRLFSDADDIIVYEKKFDTPAGVFRLAQTLKNRKFDATILLQNAIEAAIIALSARIPLRAGYDSDARRLLLTHPVHRTQALRKIHQVDYYLEMVKALGCMSVPHEMHLETKLNLLEARNIAAQVLSDTQRPMIGIAPGAAYGPAKRWFPDRFAAVADRLGKTFSAQIIILGGKSDEGAASEVQNLIRVKCTNLAGKTSLREAVYLISRCRLFISNDSGLMHIAGALNVPTVAVFGSTNPATTAPVGAQSKIVRREVDCSPCLKKTCPTDFRCMKMISVDDVLSVAQPLFVNQPMDRES